MRGFLPFAGTATLAVAGIGRGVGLALAGCLCAHLFLDLPVARLDLGLGARFPDRLALLHPLLPGAWLLGHQLLAEQRLAHELVGELEQGHVVLLDLRVGLLGDVVTLAELVAEHEAAEHVAVVGGHKEELQAHLVGLAHAGTGGLLLQDQLVPAFVVEVKLVAPLFLAVLGHGHFTILLVPLAVCLLHQGVLALGLAGTLLADGEHGQRIVTADRGTVLVDGATLLRIEKQAGALVGGAHLQPGHLVLVHGKRHRVGLEELLRGHAQALLQAQDVVGRQGDVGHLAAGIEAGDAGMAVELQLALGLEHRGQRGALEGDVELFVTHVMNLGPGKGLVEIVKWTETGDYRSIPVHLQTGFVPGNSANIHKSLAILLSMENRSITTEHTAFLRGKGRA